MTSLGGFNEEVERVVLLSDIPELDSDDVVRAMVRHETDRASGKDVLIWVVALDRGWSEIGERLTKSQPGFFRVKEGRTILGVSSEQHDAVNRLAEFYTQRLNEIHSSIK
jgi:hypothetical protein